VEQVVTELSRKFNVYYILPSGTSYAGDGEVLDAWRDLLGERVLELDDLDTVCETIALTIGITEDVIDLDDGLEDLRDVGADQAVRSVGRALARYARTVAPRAGGTVAVPGGWPGFQGPASPASPAGPAGPGVARL
jgi:hypothetical protein